MKTCRNCDLGKQLSSEHCNINDYPNHPNWRPRRWVVITRIIIATLVILGAALIMWGILDPAHKVVKVEPVGKSWTFGRPALPVGELMVSAKTWEVVEPEQPRAVTWTQWPGGGCAISEGK